MKSSYDIINLVEWGKNMIKSMTGFGRGEYSDGKRNVTAEIKTVNHRYSDITVKMPKAVFLCRRTDQSCDPGKTEDEGKQKSLSSSKISQKRM